MSIKLNLQPITSVQLDGNSPLIIAGPCSAETEEQVMQTASQLKEINIPIFRAGIWKPRTRPNSFEGIGSQGLPWLKRVQSELGLLTAIEVANANHVFEALKYKVDILWIGARTSANPFAVQEIANALAGADIPVFIKNPVNPDVELWIGALERINQAGIHKLAAIHRGFSTYHNSLYRNAPQWQIPIELKRRIPQLPVIVDPSHICGNRERLLDISQKAMDLNFNGLMIESHITPDQAVSDARQQITPTTLQQLLSKLVIRKPDPQDVAMMRILEDFRNTIDEYDEKLLEVLVARMKVAAQIGRYKKETNLTILQSKRWDELLRERSQKAINRGLSDEFIIRILRAIHQESINVQNRVMNNPE